MRLTNTLRLPEPIVEAVANDDYSRGDAEISVTQLIQPPRKVELERRHADELTEDVSDRIWSLVGQIAHGVLERANRVGVVERRLYMEAEGWRVSGRTDRLELVHGQGFSTKIIDWKVTTAWQVKGGGVKSEWVEQLNCYAELLRQNGYTVTALQVIAILRDWSKLEALRTHDYPKKQVVVFDIPLWPPLQAQLFISGRVLAHQKAREVLPDCTDDERWYRGEAWAVYRNENKTATRVLSSPGEAEDFIIASRRKDEAAKKKSKKPHEYRIEYRPGENVRCASYCGAAPFCLQWKALNDNANP